MGKRKDLPRSIKNQIIKRDKGLCRACGSIGKEIHHITPVVFGGTDDIENLILLCYICHYSAPNTKEEFAIYLKRGGARSCMIIGMGMLLGEEYGCSAQVSFEQVKKAIDWSRKQIAEEYSV